MLFTFDTNAVIHLINKLPTSLQRMTAAGYVGRKVWATPDEHDEIQRLLKSLRE